MNSFLLRTVLPFVATLCVVGSLLLTALPFAATSCVTGLLLRTALPFAAAPCVVGLLLLTALPFVSTRVTSPLSSASIKKFKTLYYDAHGEKSVGVVCARPHGNIALLRLDGCATVEKAASLRGKVLYMRRSDAHLKKGDWFIAELIGCRAEDANSGKVYGTVTDVSQTGANDVWHITDDNGTETLIPAIPDVVSSVDVENGIVLITPLKGLFSDED